MDYNIKTKVIAESDCFTKQNTYGETTHHTVVIIETSDSSLMVDGIPHDYIVSVTDYTDYSDSLVGGMLAYQTEEEAWHKFNLLLKKHNVGMEVQYV
jgi:hypothetical protein